LRRSVHFLAKRVPPTSALESARTVSVTTAASSRSLGNTSTPQAARTLVSSGNQRICLQSHTSSFSARNFATHNMGSTSFSIKSTYKLNNGLEIPRFGLGTWRSEPGQVEKAVKEALLNGYIHIDTAKQYLNQQEVGQGIRDALKENSQLKREQIWVTSKLWNTHHEPSRARQQIDDILQELGLEYLDLLLIHWPVQWTADQGSLPDNPKHETHYKPIDTWRVLEEGVKSGKLRSIGISNFTEQQADEILKECEIKPVINQCESHPYFNNIQLQKDMEKRGIAFESYSPLGNVGGDPKDSPMAEESIKTIAKKHNKSPAQVIIRWHLQSNIIVIPKSSKPERAVENSKVFDFELTEDEIKQIDQLHKGKRSVNPPFYPNKQKVFPAEKL